MWAACALAVSLFAISTELLRAADRPAPESPRELLVSSRGMDLYKASPSPDVGRQGESPQTLLRGVRYKDLYRPSLPPPIVNDMTPRRTPSAVVRPEDLYKPAIADLIVGDAETPRVLPTSFQSDELYGPAIERGLGSHEVDSSRDLLAGANAGTRYAPASEASELLIRRRAVKTVEDETPEPDEPPHELSKVSLPAYRIEPPDVVQILAVKLVPRQPYHIEEFDMLQIQALGTLLDQPINNYYLVQADGTVDLGPVYGKVRVAGMTADEANHEITRKLKALLQQPVVSLLLARAASVQQVNRNYQVQSDGTVDLGRYGMVSVTGKTITEARLAVEDRLSMFFDGPTIGLDVVAYNSKKYYIIIAGAEVGEPIVPVPITGNETVLDALSQINGLPRISSKTMWLARPAPNGFGCEQILPIDWAAITRGARADSNYQILPGDRIYIVDDKLIATEQFLSKFTNPIERHATDLIAWRLDNSKHTDPGPQV